MRNVKGILARQGSVIKQIVTDFEEAGYITNRYLVNMANYGIPQTRQRVFIVGMRKDLAGEFNFIFPKETHRKENWVSIKEAIGHFPGPSENNIYVNHIGSAYKLVYRNFTGHRKTSPDKPSPTILARGNGKGGVCAIPHYMAKGD